MPDRLAGLRALSDLVTASRLARRATALRADDRLHSVVAAADRQGFSTLLIREDGASVTRRVRTADVRGARSWAAVERASATIPDAARAGVDLA